MSNSMKSWIRWFFFLILLLTTTFIPSSRLAGQTAGPGVLEPTPTPTGAPPHPLAGEGPAWKPDQRPAPDWLLNWQALLREQQTVAAMPLVITPDPLIQHMINQIHVLFSTPHRG